jgi:hypothetical protein
MFGHSASPELMLARELIQREKIVEASSLLRVEVEKNPANAEALFLLAQVARMADQLESALCFNWSWGGGVPARQVDCGGAGALEDILARLCVRGRVARFSGTRQPPPEAVLFWRVQLRG